MQQSCTSDSLGDTRDSSGRTNLHHSSKNRETGLTRLLIRRGCDVDAQDNDGMTPLMLAVINLDEDTVRILLDAKADVYIENHFGQNVLQMAFSAKISEHNTLLCLLRCVQDASSSTEEVALRLIAANCPLYRVVILRNTAIIRRMIELGADVHAKHSYIGSTALCGAVMECDPKMVELLLEHNVDVNVEDIYGLTAVGQLHNCNCECRRCCGRFLDKLEILRMLIDAGAVLTSISSVGYFQVWSTLKWDSREAIGIILRSNVDFAARDRHGLSLLDHIVHNTNKGVIEELRPYISKFDVNAFDSLGKCTLSHAVHCRNIEAVRLLLDNGANVNCAEKVTGATPLFKCFPAIRVRDERKHDECVEMLLEYGACPQVVCNDENVPTIFDVGRMTKRYDRVKLVIARLAMMLREGVPLIQVARLKIEKCEIYKRYFGLCRLALRESYGSVDFFQLLTVEESMLKKCLNEVECLWKLLTDNEKMKKSHVHYYNVLKKRIAKVLSRHSGTCECALPLKLEVSRMLEMNEKVLARHLRCVECLRNFVHICYDDVESSAWVSLKKRMAKIIWKTDLQDKAAVWIWKISGGRLDRYHIVMEEILRYLDDESLEVLSWVSGVSDE